MRRSVPPRATWPWRLGWGATLLSTAALLDGEWGPTHMIENLLSACGLHAPYFLLRGRHGCVSMFLAKSPTLVRHRMGPSP